jgi:hypothetical protein
MADFDAEDWENRVANIDPKYQNRDRAIAPEQLLGPWTIIALMLNRTIGVLLSIRSQETFPDS